MRSHIYSTGMKFGVLCVTSFLRNNTFGFGGETYDRRFVIAGARRESLENFYAAAAEQSGRFVSVLAQRTCGDYI